MIDKIAKIGRCNSKLSQRYQIPKDRVFFLNLNTTVKIANCIVINLQNTENGTWYVSNQFATEFRHENQHLFLFKTDNGGSNAVSPYPTLRCDSLKLNAEFSNQSTEEQDFILVSQFRSIAKKLINKKMSRIANNTENISIQESLTTLVEWYNAADDETLLPIARLLSIEKTAINLISIQINGQYLGEAPELQEMLETHQTREHQHRPYYNKYDVSSIAYNQLCSICCTVQDTVYGFGVPWTYYSSNENAYIAGGFNKVDSWKNVPTCPDCIDDVLLGQRIVEKYLRRNFYGTKYYLIPSILFGDDDIFTPVLQRVIQASEEVSLAKKNEAKEHQRAKIEDLLLHKMTEESDQLQTEMQFFDMNNSEFKLLAEISSLLPSRCRILVEHKEALKQYPAYQNLRKLYANEPPSNLVFNFGIVRYFFYTSSSAAPFLDICSRIFQGHAISKDQLISTIMEKVIRDFKNKLLDPSDANPKTKTFEYSLQRGMLLLHYCYKLNLITPLELEISPMTHADAFFTQYHEMFTQNWQKTTFLTGSLANLLLNIQRHDIKENGGTTPPFRRRLNDLRINEQILRRIYTEAIEKLEQYDKNFYRTLEQELTELFLNSPNLSTQSTDNLSFYFTMGMQMSQQIKNLYTPASTEAQTNTENGQ